VLGEDPARLRLEPRVAEGTARALAGLGHPVQEVNPWDLVMGFCHAIEMDEEPGALAGAADPRGDSIALGI
jgi:gamma-glutamyltranspeptidase/glutathione hydrolase